MNTGKEELKRLLNEAPKDLKCMWERLDAPRLPRNATFDSRKLGQNLYGYVANNCLHLFLKKFALNFERIANNCAEL